jgi:predicted Zn-ribbon and HTH transcriptional regulator
VNSAFTEITMRTKAQRKKSPKAYKDVLLKSRRRCCLCFGLKGDHGEKKGQIAHLDHDPANGRPDNLAFLCLEHHDQYDSTTSQSKSLQIGEVKAYREKLYQFLVSSKLHGRETSGKPNKNKSSKPLSAPALNAHLAEKPHKCSYCGYSFSIMPELEEGKAYFVKAATCPKCGNVDEVLRSYQG